MASTIEAIDFTLLSFPLERRFQAAVRLIGSIDLVLTSIRTVDGLMGYGCGFAFGESHAGLLAHAAEDLGAGLIGRDALMVEARAAEMSSELALLGLPGLGVSALGILDLGLWDLRGKATGLPVATLLGGAHDTVPAYGSGGSLALTTDELAAEMAGYAAEGCQSVKLKLGGDPAADRERVAAVRAAIGDGVRILVDGNQQWDVAGAVAAATNLAEFDIWWLEEPVPADDVRALAEVRRRAPVRIAVGETNFTTRPFADMLRAEAADVLMPNLQRVGGLTAWRKIAASAELQGVAMASHVHPEFNAHVVAGTPNAILFEHLPWWPSPFIGRPPVAGGVVRPSGEPGFGVTPDRDVIRRHTVGERHLAR